MVIPVSPDLEAALKEAANRQGVAPEDLAIGTLRMHFLKPALQLEPRDEWERGLLALGTDCGISLPDSAFDRESLYD